MAFLRLRIPSPRPSAALLGSGVFPGAASTAQPFGALLAQVINTHGIQIDALISALEEKDLVKTLAEPNLISQSGQRAQFFAGTEIPIPTVQPGTTGTTPTVTTTYYPCGVTLGFEPTVLNTGLINLHLTPQVCEVATTTSPVVVNGTTIPQLTTRSADTDVELRDGQSFAIAGLLQAQDVNQLSQLPWLGNVPVLGALFRSTNYQKAGHGPRRHRERAPRQARCARHAPRDAVRHHAAGERHRPVPDGRRRSEEEIHRIRHQRRRPAGALRPHPGGQVMRARSLQIVAALGLAAALGGCNPAGYPTCYRVECPYPPVYQNSYAGYVPAYTDGRPAFGEPPFDDPFADYTQRSLTINADQRQRSGGERGRCRRRRPGHAIPATPTSPATARGWWERSTISRAAGVRPSGRPCPRPSKRYCPA